MAVDDDTDSEIKQQQQHLTHGIPIIVSGAPLYPDKAELGGKFVVQGWKDTWAAVLFLIGNAVVIGIGAYNYIAWANGTTLQVATALPQNTPQPMPTEDITQSSLLYIFLYSFLFSIPCSLLAAMSLLMFVHTPRQSIIISNVMMSVWCIVQSILLLTSGMLLMGGIFFALSLVNCLVLYWWWHRISFSAQLLRTASIIVIAYRALLHTAMGMVLVNVLYIVPWSFLMLPSSIRQYNVLVTRQHIDGQLDPADTALTLFALLMLYWTYQVTYNITHVTTCGVTATWYFCGGTRNMPKDPTLHAFKRSVTTSFGSICFGSLLVAVFEVMRFVAHHARVEGQDSFIACMIECVIACITRLLEYFNRYAFVYCAIYGYGYIEAGCKTKDLAANNWFSALFNDSLIATTLWMTALGASVWVGLLMWLFTNITLAIVFGSIAFFIFMIVFKNIDSALVTLFVCYCEEPEVLALTYPELFAALQDADCGPNSIV